MRGHATKVGLGLAASLAATRRFEFISCGFKSYDGLIGGDGSEIRAGRSRHQKHKTQGVKGAAGTLVLEPRPDDIPMLGHLAFGTAIATNVIALAETVPKFYADVKYGSVDDVRFIGGKVNRLTINSSTNQKMRWALDCEFEDYDDTITFPSIDNTLSTMLPYAHNHSVFTLDTIGGSSAVAYKSTDWEVVLDNMLDTGLWENSRTRFDMEEGDRAVTMRGSFGFTSAVKTEFGAALLTGLVGILAYTYGAYSLTIDFPCMQWPYESPDIPGKNAEVRQAVQFDCVETDSAKEIKLTNISA